VESAAREHVCGNAPTIAVPIAAAAIAAN